MPTLVQLLASVAFCLILVIWQIRWPLAAIIVGVVLAQAIGGCHV